MIESRESPHTRRSLPYRFTRSTDIMHSKCDRKPLDAKKPQLDGYEHFRVNFVKLYDQYQRGDDSICDTFPEEDIGLAEKLASLQMIDFETIQDDKRGRHTPEPFFPRRQSVSRMGSRRPIVKMTKSKIVELSKRFTSKFRICSSPLNSPKKEQLR